MLSKVQRIVVAGVLLNRGKVLLLQRGANEKVYPNLWELPSGKKEFGEEVVEALKREFREEAGLSVEPVRVISFFDYTVRKGGENRETTQINFLVRLRRSNEEVRLSREHQASAWVGLKEMKRFKISPATKEVIRAAIKQS